jgi:hypothetical protein
VHVRVVDEGVVGVVAEAQICVVVQLLSFLLLLDVGRAVFVFELLCQSFELLLVVGVTERVGGLRLGSLKYESIQLELVNY